LPDRGPGSSVESPVGGPRAPGRGQQPARGPWATQGERGQQSPVRRRLAKQATHGRNFGDGSSLGDDLQRPGRAFAHPAVQFDQTGRLATNPVAGQDHVGTEGRLVDQGRQRSVPFDVHESRTGFERGQNPLLAFLFGTLEASPVLRAPDGDDQRSARHPDQPRDLLGPQVIGPQLDQAARAGGARQHLPGLLDVFGEYRTDNERTSGSGSVQLHLTTTNRDRRRRSEPSSGPYPRQPASPDRPSLPTGAGRPPGPGPAGASDP